MSFGRPAYLVGVVLLSTAYTLLGATVTTPRGWSAAISGVVREAVSSQAVSGAVVSVALPGRGPGRRQLTDRRGRYLFDDLAPDAGYRVTVSKAGFFDGAFGRFNPQSEDSMSIALGIGEWFSGADIRMWRPGVISGSITNEWGQPMAGVLVRALRQGVVAGHMRWVAGPLATTDDQGNYRVTNLTTGEYFVVVPSTQLTIGTAAKPRRLVSIRNSGHYPVLTSTDINRCYPVTFSGSVMSIADATGVKVDLGYESAGIDIAVRSVPCFKVTGVVQGLSETPTNLVLRLLAAGLEDLEFGHEVAMTRSGPDGSFEFASVPSGDYVIDVPVAISGYREIGSDVDFSYGPSFPMFPGFPGQDRDGVLVGSAAVRTTFETVRVDQTAYWARESLSIGRHDVADLRVSARPTASVSGWVEVETGPVSPSAQAMVRPGPISLEPRNGLPWLGLPRSVSGRPPGEFTIQGVLPGPYLVRSSGTGWFVRSVIVDGRDLVLTGLDLSGGHSLSGVSVTLTNAAASLSGVVVDNTGEATRAAIIAFPVAREFWMENGLSPRVVAASRTTTSGAYEINGLPGGEYYAVAVPEQHTATWRHEEFLAQLVPYATRVALAWGQRVTRNLRLVELPR